MLAWAKTFWHKAVDHECEGRGWIGPARYRFIKWWSNYWKGKCMLRPQLCSVAANGGRVSDIIALLSLFRKKAKTEGG